MNAAPFAFGLLSGALVMCGVGVLLGEDGEAGPARQPDPTTLLPGDIDAAADAATGSDQATLIARLRAEIARLRALGADRELVAETADASLDSADGDPTPRAASTAPLGSPGAHLDDLLAELELQLRGGTLAALYADNPNQLLSMLVDTWVNAGRPADALALLQRFDVAEEFRGQAERIGERLLAAGDRVRAREAFLLALRGGNRDWDVINQLLKLDPAEALRQLDTLANGNEDDAELRVQRALLAIRSGQRDTGLAAFQQLLESGKVGKAAWRALTESSPELAEEQIRARLENAAAALDADDRVFLHTELAKSLRGQGRSEAAAEHLLAQLDAQPDDLALVRSLGNSDRGRALGWLQRQIGTAPSADLYSNYAYQLSRADRPGEAVAAYWQAFDLSAGNRRNQTRYAERALSLDPTGSAPRVATHANATRNDELFGDLADALWRAGNRSDAYRYWRRAHEIDDDDSEWIRKLKAVDEGRSPF